MRRNRSKFTNYDSPESLPTERVEDRLESMAQWITQQQIDAARYRWMRRTFVADDESWPDDVSNAKNGEELDAAIDAARSASGGE
jgi:hypothetical protein